MICINNYENLPPSIELQGYRNISDNRYLIYSDGNIFDKVENQFVKQSVSSYSNGHKQSAFLVYLYEHYFDTFTGDHYNTIAVPTGRS